MTSKTGSTQATLKGTGNPPTIHEALFGAVVQLTVVLGVWVRYTSFGSCFADLSCLSDPWARQVAVTLGLCACLWLYSLRTIPRTGTSDPSIVDRLWSILPAMYVWHFYISAPSPRLLLMAVLSTVWGVRLSANFALKGGFSGGEDYRWAEIRSWPGFDRGFELFNLLFIWYATRGSNPRRTGSTPGLSGLLLTRSGLAFDSFFQQLVILSFASPAAVALGSSAPLNGLDALATALYLALVGAEALADYQQLRFQTEKYRRIRAKEPPGEYARGFVDSGLWAYSRHPNYFCEIALWWAFYLFGPASGAPLLNMSLMGPVFLTCLFILPNASADLTETLSSRKYAAFPEYQRRVSRFLPLPPRPPGKRAPWTLVDRLLVGWFVVGLLITFLIDIEQVMVVDPAKYGQPGFTPLWPPEPCVRAIHWWGRTADELVLARPVWFRVAIWLEILVQAPFYALAILAFVRGQSWIRLPAVVYSSVLLTIMPMVLGEQLFGPHATTRPGLVLAVYGAYVIMPVLVAWRVRHPEVFPPRIIEGAAAAAAEAEVQGPAATRARDARSPQRKKRA